MSPDDESTVDDEAIDDDLRNTADRLTQLHAELSDQLNAESSSEADE